MEKMIDHPCEINKYRNQDEVKHEGQPEWSDPGDNPGKPTRIGPFHKSGKDKGKGDTPEPGDIPGFPCRTNRNGLQPTNKNIAVNQSVNNENDANEYDKSACFQY